MMLGHPTKRNMKTTAHLEIMSKWIVSNLPAIVSSLVVSGCAAVSPPDSWTLYENAIADAALAGPVKALQLQSVPETATVPVVSWVPAPGRPCAISGCSFATGERRWWVTLDGEVRSICRKWGLQGDALRERLEQLLGLPPDSPSIWRKTHMVTFEVARGALQRPCLGETVDSSGAVRCSLRPTSAAEPEIRLFVLEQMASTWVVGLKDAPGYPFTRLGYTYDWHPSGAARHHYGASEFVVRPNADARLLGIATTDDYCGSGSTE